MASAGPSAWDALPSQLCLLKSRSSGLHLEGPLFLNPSTVSPPQQGIHSLLVGLSLEERGRLTRLHITACVFTWGVTLGGSIHVLRALGESLTPMRQHSQGI